MHICGRPIPHPTPHGVHQRSLFWGRQNTLTFQTATFTGHSVPSVPGFTWWFKNPQNLGPTTRGAEDTAPVQRFQQPTLSRDVRTGFIMVSVLVCVSSAGCFPNPPAVRHTSSTYATRYHATPDLRPVRPTT
ncbi:hypothetical protein Bbelb_330160 [Branchiostoma belcheri]|nr:hypothetical protein Bbelb_330160 [Branchiostoma belcheri]